MPSPTRPDGLYCPAREEVNERIRILMAQPASDARSAEWIHLLTRWADSCPGCPGCDQPASAA